MGSKDNLELKDKLEIMSSIDFDELDPTEQLLVVLALTKFLGAINPILVKYKNKAKKAPEPTDDPVTRMILEGLKKALEETNGEDN